MRAMQIIEWGSRWKPGPIRKSDPIGEDLRCRRPRRGRLPQRRAHLGRAFRFWGRAADLARVRRGCGLPFDGHEIAG